MKAKQINRYLIVAILTLSVLPLIASYVLLQEVLNSAVGLAIKPQNIELLESYREDLKLLRKLDKDNEAVYKSRFLAASDELNVYRQPQLLRQLLTDVYLTYYLIIFGFILVLSLLVAVWLSRKVASAYQNLTKQDIQKEQKLLALSHFDQWQVIAAKLAHEINNPLTPIEMMVTNLPRSFGQTSKQEFGQLLDVAKTVVSEEVHKLKDMVSHFSQFSKLPEPQLKPQDMLEIVKTFIQLQGSHWPEVKFNIQDNDTDAKAVAMLDYLLFNQCLFNLINNAYQANGKNAALNMSLSVEVDDTQVVVVVSNEGISISEQQRAQLFNLYYSTGKSSQNKGLGLCIVRKIMLDHGGDICCIPNDSGATFALNLPKVTKM